MAYGESIRRNRCGVWCWRWVVPADLQVTVGAREISRSLATSNRREAISRSLVLRLAVTRLVAELRSGCTMAVDDLRNMLSAVRGKHSRRAAEEASEVAADAESARAQAMKVALAEQARVHQEDLVRHVTAAAVASAVRDPETASGPLLSECFRAFCEEKGTSSAWTPKTAERWHFTFRLLIDGLQDRHVGEIKREQVRAFMAQLRRLPSNAQKKKALVGMTFADLTAQTGFEVISDGTVNDFMGRVSSFFKWTMKVDGYGVRLNPAEGLAVKNVRRTPRRAFSTSQLVDLFSHDSFKKREFLHPHYFWLMPLSMLTGLRLNEACQLHLKDFIEVEGVPVIRCADLGEDQRGKNENATRRVPIHAELIRLGLLRWVKQLRAAGEVQLFPELKAGRDGHGQAASKWFQRYRAACGITGKQVEVFHSFRHLFISARLDRDLAPHKVAAIVGHEVGLISADVYWSDKDAAGLLDVVNAVGLPESVAALIPVIEQVRFVKVPRLPPSRLGARKTREKRMADAAARKARKAA